MINPGLLSSASDDWATPIALFRELDAEHHFTLDVCASAENAKCSLFYTREQDGLVQPWEGVCWMNPPYGREIGLWVRKAYRVSCDGVKVVALLPARTDTRWWHEWVMDKARVTFIRGRLRFGNAKNCAPFPSAIAVYAGRS